MNYIPLPERFQHHRDLVGLIRTAGVQPPARWLEMDDALTGYLALTNTATQRLAEQIVNPAKNTDVALLRALAIAEQSETPGAIAALNAAVVAAVQREMLSAYEPVARDNYAAVAADFNAAAKRFTAAAAIVDPESDANRMVTADDAERQAWLDAELQAATLDTLVPPLIAATQLAGVRIDTANEEINQPWWTAPIDDAAVFGLTADAGTLHRRNVWQAYDNDSGRTGKWGALTALGAEIRAPKLDEFTPYRRPAPIVHRQEQIPGQPLGTVRMVSYDPEDAPKLTPIEPVRIS